LDESDDDGLTMFSGEEIKKTLEHFAPIEGKGIQMDLET
jgi:hypothetical protein